MEGSPSPSLPPGRPTPRRGHPGVALLGLAFTFVALASIALGLPSAVALSGVGFGYLALGCAGLFFGGSLLGYASGLNRVRRS